MWMNAVQMQISVRESRARTQRAAMAVDVRQDMKNREISVLVSTVLLHLKVIGLCCNKAGSPALYKIPASTSTVAFMKITLYF